jgi:hypothetical protein
MIVLVKGEKEMNKLVFKQFEIGREYFLKIIGAVSEDQTDVQPDGFKIGNGFSKKGFIKQRLTTFIYFTFIPIVFKCPTLFCFFKLIQVLMSPLRAINSHFESRCTTQF